jgi:hypothetical protein
MEFDGHLTPADVSHSVKRSWLASASAGWQPAVRLIGNLRHQKGSAPRRRVSGLPKNVLALAIQLNIIAGMNRRTFLSKVGQSALVFSAANSLLDEAHCRAETKSAAKNWIWTDGREKSKPDEQKRWFDEIRESNIQAVLLSSFNAEVLARAKAAGLETHAWIWTLCRGERQLLDQHPDWYVVSRQGDSAAKKPPYVGYYHFLCPSHEAVRDYIAKVVSDLGDTANLDGIHLDYIRYPDVILPVGLWKKYNLIQKEELPQFDFCYCQTCREAFKKQTGEDLSAISDPPADAAWRQYRYDSVTRLVNQLAEVGHAKGKQMTAAVFPTPSLAKKMVRQDWVQWNLDAVLPMTYHSFYLEKPAWIEQAVKEGVTALPANRPLYAGLFLSDLRGEGEFDQAVRFAMAGGAKGVSLFGRPRKVAVG